MCWREDADSNDTWARKRTSWPAHSFAAAAPLRILVAQCQTARERECAMAGRKSDHGCGSLFALLPAYLIASLFAQPILPLMILVALSLTPYYEVLTLAGQSASIHAPQ